MSMLTKNHIPHSLEGGRKVMWKRHEPVASTAWSFVSGSSLPVCRIQHPSSHDATRLPLPQQPPGAMSDSTMGQTFSLPEIGGPRANYSQIPRAPQKPPLQPCHDRTTLGKSKAAKNAKPSYPTHHHKPVRLLEVSHSLHNPPYQKFLREPGQTDMRGVPWWFEPQRKSQAPLNPIECLSEIQHKLGGLDREINGLCRTPSMVGMMVDAKEEEVNKAMSNMYRIRGGQRVVESVPHTTLTALRELPPDVIPARIVREGKRNVTGVLLCDLPRDRFGLLIQKSCDLEHLKDAQRKAEVALGLFENAPQDHVRICEEESNDKTGKHPSSPLRAMRPETPQTEDEGEEENEN